jgi:glycosyltransferase involved in cell wall biosynthesis
LRRKVLINWSISSYSGWGVYGLNLALAWAQDPDVMLVAAVPPAPAQLALDPVRMRRLDALFRDSAQAEAQLKPYHGREAVVQAPMLASLNANFGLYPLPQKVWLSGTPTIGVTFFETGRLSAKAVEAAGRYPLIVTGSSWNEQVLRAHGLSNARTILQGVDPSLFHPAPRPADAGDRFFVFSGGKLELRKGQDLVLAAFRRFAERHPDAVLVAAWHSPWPELARSIDRSGKAAPLILGDDGQPRLAAWAAASGVRAEQFIDAGQTPNALMPQLLRQMDVGLFPNRCEGGTNLVAMECMACGVPAILAANTGHLDLIAQDNCFVLERQRDVAVEPAPGDAGETAGWGESDVDEAVELLERAYGDRAAARRRGERGAATLAQLSWSRTAAELKTAVLEVCAAQGG